MAQINPGQIAVRQQSFSQDTCTTENDLIQNQAIKPAIREMLEIKNKRNMMTLITSGAVGKWGVNNAKRTKIPQVDKGKKFGANAYRFDVISSIEQAATIRSQVGATGSDGSFSLLMADQYLYPGQIVKFKSGKAARVMNYPQGSSASGYVYPFKVVSGTSFVFTTDVGSYLTAFPFHTGYSEGSERSDSRNKKPGTFINHPTIQRKELKITGSAESDVLWYKWADSGENIGFLPIQVDQANAQFAAEDERATIWGVSSMKDDDGTLLEISNLGNDPETGLPIITGDGFEEQIPSSNTMTGSGLNGEATVSDITDIMSVIQIGSNQVEGLRFICLTGTYGYANVQEKLPLLSAAQNTTYFQNVSQSDQVGGAEVSAGFNFQTFNINGNSVTFIVHPMFDRLDMFPALGDDGRSLMSGTYYFMGISDETPTMEILAKSANGVDRSFVQAWYGGLTGSARTPVTTKDADTMSVLKETLFCVYKPEVCGIIYKAR